jgi:hypothetical protein
MKARDETREWGWRRVASGVKCMVPYKGGKI